MTISIKSIGGGFNEAPVITELKTVGTIEKDRITVSYKVTDADLQIIRHYITISGICENKEITKNVGYEAENGIFNYTITGLTRGTTYTIQIRCSDGVDSVNSKAIQVRTKDICIYTVTIDEANSNPTSSVTYGGDAAGIAPAKIKNSGGWGDRFPFNKIRIVGFKGGQVTKAINPNDKTKYIGGENVPSDIDVMVEIPKIYWKVTTSGNKYTIHISDDKIDSSYDCDRHKVKGVERDCIYVGAYLGVVQNSKLRSISNVSVSLYPTSNMLTMCSTATNSGAGYQLFNNDTLILLRILFLLKFKTRDSQSVLGNGRDGNTLRTGYSNAAGLDSSTCFLGIEDIWTIYDQGVAGVKGGYRLGGQNSFPLFVCEDNYSFKDGNYPKNDSTEWTWGHVGRVKTNRKTLFFPLRSDGASVTTHYTDQFYITDESYYCYGGVRYPSSSTDKKIAEAGIFSSRLEESGNNFCRLVYLGT